MKTKHKSKKLQKNGKTYVKTAKKYNIYKHKNTHTATHILNNHNIYEKYKKHMKSAKA